MSDRSALAAASVLFFGCLARLRLWPVSILCATCCPAVAAFGAGARLCSQHRCHGLHAWLHNRWCSMLLRLPRPLLFSHFLLALSGLLLLLADLRLCLLPLNWLLLLLLLLDLWLPASRLVLLTGGLLLSALRRRC